MLEIGSVVDGKYKILNIIGKGGMSVVYLAMNERANKQWAIKEVRKDGAQDYEVVRQNLIAETDMLKRLKHPNLPSIIDVIDNGDTFLIIMDYIEGVSLDVVLDNSGAQAQEDVIDWAKQLCDVLGYLHSRQPPIIYRDLKPANVMLKPDGSIMLIDFGTAREFKDYSVADTTCLGTQGYAAPEQFGGHGQTDRRTDIYCLGATIYHLITDHNPCKAPYEMYPIRQWNSALSSGLEEIILTCTQRNPNDRYQSCEELRFALDHFTDLDIETKRQQSMKWRAFLASAILTVVMLIGTAVFGVAAYLQTDNVYTSLVKESEQVFDLQKLRKAISLDPEREDVYKQLIKEYIYKDEKITREEYDSILGTIDVSNVEANRPSIKYYNDFKTKFPQEYAENFAFPLGLALYFMCDDSDEATLKDWSIRWFNDVAQPDDENNNTNKDIKDLAKLLSTMADYNGRLFAVDAEDSVLDTDKPSPTKYLNDIIQLLDYLKPYDNIAISLAVYLKFANEFDIHAKEFSKVRYKDGAIDSFKYIIEEKIEASLAMLKKDSSVKDSQDRLKKIDDINKKLESAKTKYNQGKDELEQPLVVWQTTQDTVSN